MVLDFLIDPVKNYLILWWVFMGYWTWFLDTLTQYFCGNYDESSKAGSSVFKYLIILIFWPIKGLIDSFVFSMLNLIIYYPLLHLAFCGISKLVENYNCI